MRKKKMRIQFITVKEFGELPKVGKEFRIGPYVGYKLFQCPWFIIQWGINSFDER